MAIKFGKKRAGQHTILYTLITAILLCAIFLGTIGYLYDKAKAEADEMLHVQTKQIKDDIVLQLMSDRENLTTMANFAAKLYSDGEDYSLLFSSFKSIGMIENIGILNPDNTFSTKVGTMDMEGLLSFDEEKEKGVHLSGRIHDVTQNDVELIRSAVPIVVNGKTVGILYGSIMPEKLQERYSGIVQELNAQLFVYEKDSGDILINTISDDLSNISALKDRQYAEGSSYEQLMTTDKGFLSFRSKYRNERLHLHYSPIEEFDWKIALGRYDSQVFAGTHQMAGVLFVIFAWMLGIIAIYVLILMTNEKSMHAIADCASQVRKELLETRGDQNNIQDALVEVCRFAKSRSAVFFDTDGEFYHFIDEKYEEMMISEQESNRFRAELFRYASDCRKLTGKTVNIICIKPNGHLRKTNPSFYEFLKAHKIKEISYSATSAKSNHIAILAAVNPKRSKQVRMLAEKVSACFSMALYNKNHLHRTVLAATTDSLTGTLNRVAYKKDLTVFDEGQISNFSCIYIDVNELHICNNLFGHAAGDEMLLYIANALKEVFYGQKIYRIGGDEFLVFCQDSLQEEVKREIEKFKEKLNDRKYHVAIGLSFRTKMTNVEEVIREAEVRMYEEKAKYYQNKEQKGTAAVADDEYIQVKTGIREIDTMISILKENYNGIYRVSLSTDKARRILMPSYLQYNENEENFSSLFSKYVAETVEPDHHRAALSFLNYDALKHQLMEDKVPKISYKKNNGENVTLSIYKLCDTGELISDTLWVFAKA